MNLIVLTVACIALLLVLILVVKLHAFLALLLSSMALGLAAGMPPDEGAGVHPGRIRRGAGIHRDRGRAGRDDRAIPGALRRRTRAGRLAAR